MNQKAKVFGAILSSMMFIGAASAQTGPAGPYQLIATESASLIWDLSAVDSFHHPEIDVNDAKKQTQVNLDFLANPQMITGGKVSDAGTATVNLGYDGSSGWTTIHFPGNYKLSASGSSSKGVTKGTFSVSVSGTVANFEGGTRNLKASSTASFVINNATKQVSGTTKSSASASGLGSISGTDTFGPEAIPLGLGNGTWTLNMNLTTTGKVVNGSAATVTLSSGRVLNFTVKGTFTAKSNTTKIILTGTDVAKGSNLQIGMTGNVIKTIKGKLLGQTADLTR